MSRMRGFTRFLMVLLWKAGTGASWWMPPADSSTLRKVVFLLNALTVTSTNGMEVRANTLSVLVNSATAGGAEALAQMLQTEREATIYGESTFGLGAEPELLELDNGAALLVSVALWETVSGDGWNGDGIDPDREVNGEGREIAEAEADQLKQVLELIHDAEPPVAEAQAA